MPSNEADMSKPPSRSALPLFNGAAMMAGQPGQLPIEPPNQDQLQPSSGLGGRELYTREQWETQKSVIKQLYNLENKPFKRVIEILQTEHNFFPTRRQFYRKISEWGFEKNIKDKEMRTIIQSLSQRKSGGEDLAAELRGQVIDPMKIQRWQRRHGERKSVASLNSGTPYAENPSGRISKRAHALEASVESSELSTFVPSEETSEHLGTINDSKSQDLSHWSFVDIPGSPLLSRLFEALKIECEGTIPSLDLLLSNIALVPLPIPETELIVDTSQDPNDDEYLNFLTGSGSKDLLRYSHEVFQESDRFPLGSNASRDELSFSEWTHREWDFARGQPLKVNTSYLFGLSPFPASSKSTQHRTSGYGTSGLTARAHNIQAEEVEYKSRLRRLKRRLGLEDPRTLVARDDLARLYIAQFKYREAERLFRQLAIYYQRTLGLNDVRTLHAYLDVVGMLFCQAERLKARKIHQQVHDIIIALFIQDHALVLRSNLYRSRILFDIGSFEEAEKLSRQMFQVRMHTLGPRDQTTLCDMEFLCLILGASGKIVESEHLLRINSELHFEVEGPYSRSGRKCLRSLAGILNDQGRYDEGRALSQRIAENSSVVLGNDHPDTLYSLFAVAVYMRRQGNISESAVQMQKVLEVQMKILGEMDPDTCDTMRQLSFLLFDTGNHSEAANLLEKSYQGFIHLLGTDHCISLECCADLAYAYEWLGLYERAASYYEKSLSSLAKIYGFSQGWVHQRILNLGSCYKQLERNEEALALYQRSFDGIRSEHGDEHSSLAILSDRIMGLREAMAVNDEEGNKGQDSFSPTYIFVIEEAIIDEHANVEEILAEDLTPKVADWMGELFDFDLLEGPTSDTTDIDMENSANETKQVCFHRRVVHFSGVHAFSLFTR